MAKGWGQVRRGVMAFAMALACAAAPVAVAHAQIFMGPEQEKKIGAEEHPKILQQYSGVYNERDLAGYVASIGGRIAANSNDPSIGYTITLLNSPVVNAFALPGGYVYITRGIIALANSEAEVAGVLGHEIGHVTAHHTAKRYDRAMATNILGALAGILTGSSAVGQIAGLGGQAYLASFSREQEYQADELGVIALARTGYDPYAQADFLNTMGMEMDLEARLAGKDPNRVDFFASHPNTPDRVRKAIEEAKTSGVKVASRPRRHDEYLANINGMLYGDDPAEGYVRGRTFIHPDLGFKFTVPEGFTLQNTASAVGATAKDGSLIIFDMARSKSGANPSNYLVNEFAPEVKTRAGRVETFTANGMSGATTLVQVQTQQGTRNLRMVAMAGPDNMMYRFLCVTATGRTQAIEGPFQKTVYSLTRLSASERKTVKPLRVRVVTAGSGDTAASLGKRMQFDDHQEERFRAFNGLGPNDGVKAGYKYKIIAE